MLICWPASPSRYGETWPSGSETRPAQGGKVVSRDLVQAGMSQASILPTVVMCRERGDSPCSCLGTRQGGLFSPTQTFAHLDSRLTEVDPSRQLLPHEGIRVVRPFEDPLQSLQLAAVEGGAVPPLLLLPLGRPTAWAQALACGESTEETT